VLCVPHDVMTLCAEAVRHFASKQISLSEAFIASTLSRIQPPPRALTPTVIGKLHSSFLDSPLQQTCTHNSYLPDQLNAKHGTSIPGPSLVQVIHVEDVGTGRLAQLEAMDKALSDAGPQGRRVVGLPPIEDDENTEAGRDTVEGLNVGKSICKLLLEDGRGERVYGMEVKAIEEVRVGMPLGCKVGFSY